MRLKAFILATFALCGALLPGLAPAQANAGQRDLACLSTAGSGTAYACSFPVSTSPTVYTLYKRYWLVPDTTNTGAATVNFNAIGAVTIKKFVSGALADLAAGDLGTGQGVELFYDGTYMQAKLTPPTASPSTVTPLATNGVSTYQTKYFDVPITSTATGAVWGATTGLPAGYVCDITHAQYQSTTNVIAWAECKDGINDSSNGYILSYATASVVAGAETYNLVDKRSVGGAVISGLLQAKYLVENPYTITTSAAPSFNPASAGSQVLTLSANATFTATGITSGASTDLKICEPVSGSTYTVAFPASMIVPTAVVTAINGMAVNTCAVLGFHSWNGTTLQLTYDREGLAP